VCALLGLRALYFVVRGALVRLRYLKPGLAAILLFVGLKMLLYRWVHLPTGTSLAVIAGILVVAIAVSWLRAPPPG
jgi:tellurite resistance protein TerC